MESFFNINLEVKIIVRFFFKHVIQLIPLVWATII